ncbi:GreA/GreB family elongation factor [Vibrio alginolyticus]|uniref:GreA/GreB family elongation factor n=1 Tax=Vibrio TaxID=662 RepID=UPI00063DD64B|nr:MULTISPECIES: GreA/GreB family elongation factor [Vibrio]KLI71972.1 transcription elongation factor [Vibrio alginolyticus]MBS9846947.1 GreA/GreB family elongation factor [Vibrio alginolyticus]MCG9743991.1 GreA/GreB family elongation factor [Vibrio alginolyticus]MDM4738763.1 GreA/GreB family elongation factor [Vibrio alginolyticus]MDM4759111.1 GreA/GreB family elongation factor [Vibrio alginolyticus]
MNKADLVQIIIQHLEEKLQVAHASAQRAIDAATDEETVPEHKYDTLALEAAYLAHGQAMRIQDSEEELRQYRSLVTRDFKNAPVGVGAYVVLADENLLEKHFFVGPCSGGLTVQYQAQEVFVLTAKSLLGRALFGKEEGDEVDVKIGDKTTCYEVVTVC